MRYSIADYIIPALILIVLGAACFRRVNAYEAFVRGAGRATELAWGVFPYILAVLVMVQLVRVSGIAEFVARGISPAFAAVGIPSELTELILIRPFTSSGALAILNEIYQSYGADSYVARCASAIMSSSETVFYVTAVYFSATKTKNLRYCIPVALAVSILSAIVACLLCRL